MFVSAFAIAILPLLPNVFVTASSSASSNTTSTTLQPVFAYPFSGTITEYSSTATTTRTIDCRGASLRVETFAFLTGPTPAPTTITTQAQSTTSTLFICTSSPRPMVSQLSPPPAPSTSPGTTQPAQASPSAAPLPPVSTEASDLISLIKTGILYSSIISNGDYVDTLCSVINADNLAKAGFNGSAIQTEVCQAADVNEVVSFAYQSVVEQFRRRVDLLFTALLAVQVAAGQASGADAEVLCGTIKESSLNSAFVGVEVGVGSQIRKFVCGK